jgi:hypothetical protein
MKFANATNLNRKIRGSGVERSAVSFCILMERPLRTGFKARIVVGRFTARLKRLRKNACSEKKAALSG